MAKSAEELAFLETLTQEDREVAERIEQRVEALKSGVANGNLECLCCGRPLRVDRDADGRGWSANCLCGWEAAGMNGLPKN